MKLGVFSIGVKKFNRIILLIMTVFIFTYCDNSEEEVVLIEDSGYITKQSSLALLIKDAVSDDQSGNSCVIYKYPFNFVVKRPSDINYKVVKVVSDDDLQQFFNSLTTQDRLKIDFPMSLIDVDLEETVMSSLEELEDTLEMATDACSGSAEYEYCHSNNKKVFICHNGNTICVSINAINAHLDHGDTLGQCSGS